MKNIDVEKKLIDFLNVFSDGSDLYWMPLVKLKKDISVASFDLDGIYKNNDIKLLEDVFRACDITKVSTFHMGQREFFQDISIVALLYEKDDDGYNFPWDVETFYFDSTEQWLVDVSHEGTISFTGKKIAEAASKCIDHAYLM